MSIPTTRLDYSVRKWIWLDWIEVVLDWPCPTLKQRNSWNVKVKKSIWFCLGIKKLLVVDKDWIPKQRGYSLYIRPTVIATQQTLGVGPSNKALLFVICSPVGPYYKTGFSAVSLYATKKYVRAWPGGTVRIKDLSLGWCQTWIQLCSWYPTTNWSCQTRLPTNLVALWQGRLCHWSRNNELFLLLDQWKGWKGTRHTTTGRYHPSRCH